MPLSLWDRECTFVIKSVGDFMSNYHTNTTKVEGFRKVFVVKWRLQNSYSIRAKKKKLVKISLKYGPAGNMIWFLFRL